MMFNCSLIIIAWIGQWQDCNSFSRVLIWAKTKQMLPYKDQMKWLHWDGNNVTHVIVALTAYNPIERLCEDF